jgi:hypothetical protein
VTTDGALILLGAYVGAGAAWGWLSFRQPVAGAFIFAFVGAPFAWLVQVPG